jgi:hypothetical protein
VGLAKGTPLSERIASGSGSRSEELEPSISGPLLPSNVLQNTTVFGGAGSAVFFLPIPPCRWGAGSIEA